MQREIVRLWFGQYRPVECETMFGCETAAKLRSLSARMRRLLGRRDLWSLPIDALLGDENWIALISAAGDVLARASASASDGSAAAV